MRDKRPPSDGWWPLLTPGSCRWSLLLAIGGWIVGSSHVLAQSVGQPRLLPSQPYDYVGYAVEQLPAHFGNGRFGTLTGADNTPSDNPISNAGATLGRVLFYDKRLSHNNTLSCASCHHQDKGFADSSRFSSGADGDLSTRHSMGLTNARFYENGKFLRDERADSLEQQVLMPIEDPTELGMNLASLTGKLAATPFYADLFKQAFGTPQVTTERIAQSLAQFVRSLVSYQSKFDRAFSPDGGANFAAVLTAQEQLGRNLFHGEGRCSFCHSTNGQIASEAHNTGLDMLSQDDGAGGGRFKSPSLRNVAARDFYMHDGRFSTLEEVVAFYNSGIQDNPDLDFRLRDNTSGNQPIRLHFSIAEQDALVAFLRSLTDDQFLTNPAFSDPFVIPCDFNDDGYCGLDDLNQLLAAGPIASGVVVEGPAAIFDLNGDGILDQADLDRWLAEAAWSNGLPTPYLAGDANLDGFVDLSDFNRWNTHRFTSTTDWDRGDFNGDGVVDASDFNKWNVHKFTPVAPLAVPEPLGVWLVVLATWRVCDALRVRRRPR